MLSGDLLTQLASLPPPRKSDLQARLQCISRERSSRFKTFEMSSCPMWWPLSCSAPLTTLLA